jgi:hypothetical protein
VCQSKAAPGGVQPEQTISKIIIGPGKPVACLTVADGGKRDDGCLGDVLGGHWHLQVTFAQVHFAEYRAAAQPRGQTRHVGKKVLVLHCLQVKLAGCSRRRASRIRPPS